MITMYACGYKFQEDVCFNFKLGEDDTDLGFEHLLSTREIAEMFIEDMLGDDYFVLPVKVVSYNDGVLHVEYDTPEYWYYEDEVKWD